jgi:hypothetical protein
MHETLQFSIVNGIIEGVKDININHKAIKLNCGKIDIPEAELSQHTNTLVVLINNYCNIDEADGVGLFTKIDTYDKLLEKIKKDECIFLKSIKFASSFIETTSPEKGKLLNQNEKNICKSYIKYIDINKPKDNKFNINACSITGRISRIVSNNHIFITINSKVVEVPVILKNRNSKLEVGDFGLFLGSLVCFPPEYGGSRGRHGIYGEFLKDNEDKRNQS